MIIKYYTKDASLHILDNVTNVSVPANPAHGEYALDPWKVFDFDNTSTEKPERVIEFAKDGPCMLKVFGVAYICNDDGETIEKVGF